MKNFATRAEEFIRAYGLHESSSMARFVRLFAADLDPKPNNAQVICPECCHQFPAISQNDQEARSEAEKVIEMAWGLIANAWEGDWAKANKDWRDAAGRWERRAYPAGRSLQWQTDEDLKKMADAATLKIFESCREISDAAFKEASDAGIIHETQLGVPTRNIVVERACPRCSHWLTSGMRFCPWCALQLNYQPAAPNVVTEEKC